jgi:hypothetical protein
MADQEPEYRRRIRKKSEQDRHEVEREGDKAADNSNTDKIIGAVHCVAEKIDREQDKNTSQKKRDRIWQHAEVIGLWLAAAVGIAAVWIASHDAHKQAKIMQGQLDEMHIDQRAWVYVDPPVVVEPITISAGRNWQITIKFTFHNIGHLPALFAWPRFITFAPTKAEPAHVAASAYQERSCTPTSSDPTDIVGSTIFPGQTTTLIVHTGVMGRDWENTIADYGAPTFRMIGCVVYRLPNDSRPHFTDFVFDAGWNPTPEKPESAQAFPLDLASVPISEITFFPENDGTNFSAN